MMTALTTKGLRSVTVEAVEFEEPVGVRGTDRDTVVTLWEARISNLCGSKPDHVSRNKDPDVALAGAAELFAKQKDVVPTKKKRRTREVPVLDREAEALI